MQQQSLLLGGSGECSGGGGGVDSVVDGRMLHDNDMHMDDSMDVAMDGGDVVVGGGQGLE